MDLNKITTYQFGVAQSAAYRNLNKLISGSLKDHELTVMQWFVIGTIYDTGKDGIMLSALSRKLQTGLPFITNTINLLESKAMVTRKSSSSDNRSKIVTIHPDFIKECEQIELDLRAKLDASIYSAIDPADMVTYLRVLHALSNMRY